MGWARRDNANQRELDDFARRHNWEYVGFRSYRIYGFTIAVGGGLPKKFVAARGRQRFASDRLDRLVETVAYVHAVGRMPKIEGPRPVVLRIPF